MSKFKVGDKVRRINSSLGSLTFGQVGRVRNTNSMGVQIVGECEDIWHLDENMELVSEGPVRTVTRREVVGGVYGDVGVSVHPDGEIQIEMRMLTKDAKRVLSAAMILSQIAEALDDKETTK